MAASFNHISGSVIFTSNPSRSSRSVERLQAHGETAAGVRYGKAAHAGLQLIDLHWPGMSSADLANFETFLRDTVQGTSEDFTYTNPSGVTTNVRFAVARIMSTEVAFDRHVVDVTLEALT